MQKHKQLAKGHDDLRQDAVMQQFFALVNTLLAAHARTAARHLRIAGYRVVVFTSASGALTCFFVCHALLDACMPGEEFAALHVCVGVLYRQVRALSNTCYKC